MCYCGDLCCPSCGPAQGNHRCPICRAWFSEGCDHLGDDGQVRPEFAARAEETYAAEAKADEEFAKFLQQSNEYEDD